MDVQLTREIATDLVRGVSPYYTMFDRIDKQGLGTYSEQYCRFTWNTNKLSELTVEQLYLLYLECKKSWE